MRSKISDPPFLQKRLTAPGVARLARHQRGDPVGTKVSESLAQLAPGDDDPRAIEEAKGEGPDRALCLDCIAIDIDDRELALPADRLADRDQLRVPGGDCRTRTDEKRRSVELVAQIGRKHGGNLRQRVPRGLAEPRIAAIGDPARTKNERFDLVLREHQRRQHETGAQDIAEAGFANDAGALPLQRADVSIQRAKTDAEFLREDAAAHRPPMTAKKLDQVEQAFGARQIWRARESDWAVSSHAARVWQHAHHQGTRQTRLAL